MTTNVMLTSLFAECCVVNTDSSLYSCRCWSAIKKPKIGHTDWSTPPQFKSNARKNHVAEKGNQLTHSILSAWIIPEQCKMYQCVSCCFEEWGGWTQKGGFINFFVLRIGSSWHHQKKIKKNVGACDRKWDGCLKTKMSPGPKFKRKVVMTC